MINKGMFSSLKDNWTTPKWLFDDLNKIYNFTLDAAADKDNALCKDYFDKENKNALLRKWYGNVWVNPPYGKILKDFVKKASEQIKYCNVIVMLIPARTDTKYFHEYIYMKNNVEIKFLKGRLKFSNSKNSAPFPSMIVIFKNNIKGVF